MVAISHRLIVLAATVACAIGSLAPWALAIESVEQWSIFEVTLQGPNDGNPFRDVQLSVEFRSAERSLVVRGFYDGDGTYRVRFMPPAPGRWRYVSRSNRSELADKSGEFACTAPKPGPAGPVRVEKIYHFAHADGTPYMPLGTTAYGWIHADEALQEQTLRTLESSPFNKVRMCVLPTRYGEQNPPRRFPFQRAADGKFDLSRFDIEFFRNLETRIGQLRNLRIQADLILFHPYDDGQMGFDRMTAEEDAHYLRYVVARLAAYSNVWWSLANEFDLMTEKTDADFDRAFQIVRDEDPYQHLRSVHFSKRMYDPAKPWVSHVSIQNGLAAADFGRAVLYRQMCAKPIVLDEVCYEGNIEMRWGQLSGQEMLLRFWMGTIAGTYVGHGEALREPGQPTWLSKGGVFRGESVTRIAFLREILQGAPWPIEPIDQFYETRIGGKPGEFYLVYFGRESPAEWAFELPRYELADGMKFRVDVLDTWDRSIKPIDQPITIVKESNYLYRAEPALKIALPGKPYMALRIRRIAE